MSKHKTLDECNTITDLKYYAEHHGLTHDRFCGGHDVYKNEKGSMPFSTHCSNPSKKLLHAMRKQIAALTTMLIFGFVIYGLFLLQ